MLRVGIDTSGRCSRATYFDSPAHWAEQGLNLDNIVDQRQY